MSFGTVKTQWYCPMNDRRHKSATGVPASGHKVEMTNFELNCPPKYQNGPFECAPIKVPKIAQVMGWYLLFRHASVSCTYPCPSVRRSVGRSVSVILPNFHSIRVSGYTTKFTELHTYDILVSPGYEYIKNLQMAGGIFFKSAFFQTIPGFKKYASSKLCSS